MSKVTPDPPAHLEDTLVHVNDLLRCAMATACETTDQFSGQQRDLSRAVVHILEMAQALLQQSLVAIEMR